MYDLSILLLQEMHFMCQRAFILKSITGVSLFSLRHLTLMRVFHQTATLGQFVLLQPQQGQNIEKSRGQFTSNALEENL